MKVQVKDLAATIEIKYRAIELRMNNSEGNYRNEVIECMQNHPS